MNSRQFILLIWICFAANSFSQSSEVEYYTNTIQNFHSIMFSNHIKNIAADSLAFTNREWQMIDGTYWREYSDIKVPRLAGVMAIMLVTDFIVQKKQSEYWYTKETVKFHTTDFSQDMKRYQQMDKLGHFTDAYFVSDLTSKAFRWSGMSGESSVWFGALSGWLWTLQIEFYDAHSSKWGWSWGDLMANTLGSGFFVLQQFNYSLLGGIYPKYSYHLSEEWDKFGSKKPGAKFIQDYSGMTFWITINPHHYFPDSWKQEYPDWLAPLGIAFGFGVNNVIFDSLKGERELFIGLDIDLRKIPLGDDIGIIQFIKSELNIIRLPLPAVRITPSGIWYGLYF